MVDLGPAELYVVKEIRTMIESCKESSEKLVEQFDEIDLDRLEEAMVDHEKKESLMLLLDQLKMLEQNLSVSILIPTVAWAMLKDRESDATS